MKRTVGIALLCLVAAGCSSQHKLSSLRKQEFGAWLSLEQAKAPQAEIRARPQALKVRDDDGREMEIMDAILDEETGEMVATDVLETVTVVATFKNVAERGGKVLLKFHLSVPQTMMDRSWQLRISPRLRILGRVEDMDAVILTGRDYRREQLRGYQHYERFISKIVEDSTAFIDIGNLERFLRRNIPQIYSFKTDSTFVADTVFYSAFNLKASEALSHYTDKHARDRNDKRRESKDRMFTRYVKNPILTRNIQIDTIIDPCAFEYDYEFELKMRPKLKKAEVFLEGGIYLQDKSIYSFPQSDTLSFYISSLSMFSDTSTRYKKVIVERMVLSNETLNLQYAVGKSEIDTTLGSNARELSRLDGRVLSLLEDRDFDLDSIVVISSASPDGRYSTNENLSRRRSNALRFYLKRSITLKRDSLQRESLDPVAALSFKSRYIAENWDRLTLLIGEDSVLTLGQKKEFYKALEIKDPDRREAALRQSEGFEHIKTELYPRLRASDINFHMHRKGMVKDTIHTSVPDTLYMRGVHLLCDMDYEAALEILKEYQDYNTAVAYLALDRNASALEILEKLDSNAQVEYLKAILCSRLELYEKAREHYFKSCELNPSYVHRGNLDPEIARLK